MLQLFLIRQVELPYYDGGALKNLAGTNNNDITNIDSNEWVLQIDPVNGAKIEFESKFDVAPIGLGYVPRQEHAKYPRVETTFK
jgi:hypothetical protein